MRTLQNVGKARMRVHSSTLPHASVLNPFTALESLNLTVDNRRNRLTTPDLFARIDGSGEFD